MRYYRVTHPNGLTEIMGEPTPQEEIAFLTRMSAVKGFSGADYRATSRRTYCVQVNQPVFLGRNLSIDFFRSSKVVNWFRFK